MKFLFGQLESRVMPTILLVLFLVFFVGLGCWIFSRGRKPVYQQIERLPFEND